MMILMMILWFNDWIFRCLLMISVKRVERERKKRTISAFFNFKHITHDECKFTGYFVWMPRKKNRSKNFASSLLVSVQFCVKRRFSIVFFSLINDNRLLYGEKKFEFWENLNFFELDLIWWWLMKVFQQKRKKNFRITLWILFSSFSGSLLSIESIFCQESQ